VEFDDIRAFIAIVERGGFRAAADAIRVAQPSLSRRVTRLEATLGLQLLERGPRGANLTPQGAVFLQGARRLLSTMEEVRSSTTGRWSGVIRLGCAATAAGSFLARFLATWIPTHPEVYLMMIEDGARALRRRLENRECDLAIVASPLSATLEHHLVQRVTVQALLPPGHKLAAGAGLLSVEELDQERVLVNGDQFLSTELLMAACRVAGVQPKVVYECSVGQTLAALAEAGLGIAIMGDTLDLRGFQLPRRFICDRNGEPLTFDLHIAWMKERQLHPLAYALADELTKSRTVGV
jgi:DNA-binding transcriptional LysR family regulator